jgi:penicillin-binding protein 1A
MDSGKSRFKRVGDRAKRFLRDHKKAIRVTSASLGGVALLLLLGCVALLGVVGAGLPDVTKLNEYDPSQTTKIYSRDGTLVATLFDQNRTPVTIDEIAPAMKEAIVAIEDRRFFEHEGVDYRGILRAAFGNAVSGEVEQGASTLTMQLARGLFLNDERTYTRKLREAILARKIDSTLSKEKILELYLNEVYFGAGAYGIDAAASVYFKKNPKDLNLWQSALLAGLVQAPSSYSPIANRELALKRMDEVLAALEDSKSITPEQRQSARAQAAEYKFKNNSLKLSDGMLKYPYFTTYATKLLFDEFPENYVRRGGLQVYTTLDIDLQSFAEQALSEEVAGPGAQLGADSGAVVVLDNQTGQILAMVGGTEWDTENQFNRAWQARRQPGSSFKPFVYTTALEAGFTPEHEFADTEAVFNYDVRPWSPSNSDGRFMGAIPMRTGLQFSRNVVAAKVMAHVGPARVISLAREMGITAELPEVTSLALGAGEISPLDMARAYSVFPNGGILKKNSVFLRVTDTDGQLLKEFGEPSGSRVITSNTARQMCEMLRRVVTAGTGTAANVPGVFTAGKTGTTDKFIDAWFVGFTPHHTMSVWIGRDDNKPMGRVYGGTLPANVFRRVAEHASGKMKKTAPLPGVTWEQSVTKELCWDSTYLALPGCTKTYQDVFAAGVVPTRNCPMHRQTKKEVVVVKTVDGTLTNVTDEGELVADSGLRVDTPMPEDDEQKPEDELDPRNDPEVVKPNTAMIPYREEEPEGKVKVVEIKIEKKYPDADAAEGGEVYRVTEDGDVRTDESPVETMEDVPSETPGDIKRVEVNNPYPQADSSTPTETRSETEVIYTNQDISIPADPLEDEQ